MLQMTSSCRVVDKLLSFNVIFSGTVREYCSTRFEGIHMIILDILETIETETFDDGRAHL